MNTKVITGVDTMNISLLQSNLPYKAEEGSQNYGKLYNRYGVDGVAFVAASDSDFAVRFANEEPLHSVSFNVNEDDQLSLTAFITAKKFDAYDSIASRSAARKIAIEAGNLEMLAAL